MMYILNSTLWELPKYRGYKTKKKKTNKLWNYQIRERNAAMPKITKLFGIGRFEAGAGVEFQFEKGTGSGPGDLTFPSAVHSGAPVVPIGANPPDTAKNVKFEAKNVVF